LVVEDIYDTGASLDAINKALKMFNPNKLMYAIGFHKKNPKNLEYNFLANYTGFFIPNSFVGGYGMDYNENIRDIPHLCVLEQRYID
jgi:hypoxanthine phosphoribosyltransferase